MRIRIYGIDPLSGQRAGEGEVFEGETDSDILRGMKDSTPFGRDTRLDTYRRRLAVMLGCRPKDVLPTMLERGLAVEEKPKP